MIIAHNISAINTYKSMGIATTLSNKSMEKLSSGFRINRAGDDAAGLSISEKMRAQIRGLNQASRNAQDGISMIQTAEGALNEEHSILQRMRELAVQAATDTNADTDRDALQNEMSQLTSEVNRIGNTTEFNGMKILNGDKSTQYTGGTSSSNAQHGVTYTAVEKGVAGNKIKIEHKTDPTAVTEEGGVQYNKTTNTVTFTFRTAGEASLEKIQELISSNSDVRNLIKASGGPVTGFGTGTVTLNSGTDPTINTANDSSVYFHVGANQDQVINASFNDMRASKLGITLDATTYAAANDAEKKVYTSLPTVNNGTSITSVEYALNISTRKGANGAISRIDDAIKTVSSERSKYGAVQNRIEYTINNLNTTSENLQSAESRIRDVDMASEMMEMTKNNILQQASQTMLSQALQRPQQALQLLQG